MARKSKDIFHFKKFSVRHSNATHKVGTDGVLLGTWAQVGDALRILDIGTGSGVIALIMAQRSSVNATIHAIDISPGDCQQAQENVATSPWPGKIIVSNVALQDFQSTPYDLLVSNPPFFIDSAKPPKEERMKARHTIALSPEDLLFHSHRLLHPAGKLCLILPPSEAQQLIHHATKLGWYCTRKCEFKARENKPVERILFELQLTAQPMKAESLVLYDHDEIWSNGYKDFTRDFYLNI